VRLLNQADVKAKFASAGSDTVGTSPKELADTLRVEVAKWGKVIKDAGIQPD
jgi:tripartite-type tricarboxylate transporter receptor subunit TctC